ncbi:adapter molecule Crk-like isoform X3 [Mya arenaria]|uniref:adapter molecule Crk-like isoform X3 n=1 Tax=Mya arenaria TaxID=6604 RepID=UPI0022E8CCEA|nr:adapter molecule Crk-like isoform X3 [Mya arenaria]
MANVQDFDPNDKTSWYFGPLSRDESNAKLDDVRTNGVFLVRESQSIKGDYVLVVREDNKISHYIINRIQVGGNEMFRIGDQQFPDIPALLNFYKTHYLDTTALTFPAPRDKVIGKYAFPGNDPEDLPFKKGEVLELISKDEDKWWCAKNSAGRTGQIPVPYIAPYKPDPSPIAKLASNGGSNSTQEENPQTGRSTSKVGGDINTQIHLPQLPAEAVVIKGRVPNLFDKTQLKLNEGDIVTVTRINANGQWEGQIGEKNGFFPFTHVKFLDDNS